jgi:multidrug efflux pump subunit AcrA (membrane-fusion protein)
MRFLRRSLVGVFLLSTTAALLGLAVQTVVGAVTDAMSEETPERPTEERVFATNVVSVEPGTVVPELRTFGQIESRRTLEVRATVSGVVVDLADGFEEGGAVAAGTVIARIDPADAEAARAVAEADLEEAEAELRDAERTLDLARAELTSAQAQADIRLRALDRQRDLSERGVGTAATVEAAEIEAATAEQAVVARRRALSQAEAGLDRAGTGLDRRRIDLAEAERQLGETEIRAEFDGILSEVSAVEGGLVAANERLALLVDPDALEVAFRLSTAQYRRLLDADGRLVPAEVTASLDVLGADLAATGRISRGSAVVGEGRTGRLVYARLGDAAGFRPGDFVTVTVDEPPLAGVATIPAAAVDGTGIVLAVDAQQRLEAVPVDILRRQGDDVIVVAGAIAGRDIVAERSPLLGAGIRVRPLHRGAGPAEATDEMVELSEARRAALVAFVEANDGMPSAAKERVLAQLREPQVPAQVVARIEQRMGG